MRCRLSSSNVHLSLPRPVGTMVKDTSYTTRIIVQFNSYAFSFKHIHIADVLRYAINAPPHVIYRSLCKSIYAVQRVQSGGKVDKVKRLSVYVNKQHSTMHAYSHSILQLHTAVTPYFNYITGTLQYSYITYCIIIWCTVSCTYIVHWGMRHGGVRHGRMRHGRMRHRRMRHGRVRHGGTGRSWRGGVRRANWAGVGMVPVVAPNINCCHGFTVARRKICVRKMQRMECVSTGTLTDNKKAPKNITSHEI